MQTQPFLEQMITEALAIEAMLVWGATHVCLLDFQVTVPYAIKCAGKRTVIVAYLDSIKNEWLKAYEQEWQGPTYSVLECTDFIGDHLCTSSLSPSSSAT